MDQFNETLYEFPSASFGATFVPELSTHTHNASSTESLLQNNQCHYNGTVESSSIPTNTLFHYQASLTPLETIKNPISVEPACNENTVPNQVSTKTHNIFDHKEHDNILKTNLKELIRQDSRGEEVLTLFKNNKTLDRSKLSSILIDSVITCNNPDARISQATFYNWAVDIVRLIPIEIVTTWYKPYGKASNENKKRGAGGALYNAYTYKRKLYRKIGLLKNSKKQATLQKSQNLELINNEPDILWLKHNNAPWTEVLLRWNKTRKLRNECYKYSIQTYFDNYCCLRTANGYILLENDFNAKYEGYENNFFTNWPKVAEKIIQIAKKLCKVPEISNILTKYKHLVDNNISLLAFFILPFLMNAVQLRGTKGRCSKLEVQQTFFIHVESLENLQSALEDREIGIKKRKTSNQPFMIFVGPLGGPVNSSIQINNICYDLCTPEKAIDVCFKSHFALNAEYQEECRNVWTFIERKVFNINVSKYHYADVNKLISTIDLNDQSASA